MATEYRQRPGMGDHFDDEDLVMSSAQQRRNWRGILIALMVIVAVLAMIVTSVVLLTPPQPEELSDSYSDLDSGDRTGSDYYYNQRANDELWWRHRGMRSLRLSDILTDSANIKVFNGTWISGTEIFYVTGSGDLAIMEIMADGNTQTTHRIMSKKMLQKLKGPLVSFELSPDRNHVLIGHQAKKLFRYSKTARYTVYTVSTRQMTPITLEDHGNETISTDLQPYLQHAQWHKISTATEKSAESMALIVVYRYDVFYVPWSMKISTTTPGTNIGKNNVTVDSQTLNVTNSSYTPTSTPSLSEKYENVDDNNTSSHNVTWKPWPHGPVRRITTSGSGPSVTTAGVVSNGIADYLYETEILKRSPAIWASSGRYLMYATFDDRRVGEYKYSVYTKSGRQHDHVDDDDTEKHSKQRKLKRRRRRLRRNSKPVETLGTTGDDGTSDYYLYPRIRTLKYPKANTPNPIVTLSVIVNLDQLENPQIQPKIRTLTPPPIFQFTDDYYFTAVQWVNDGGVGIGSGNHEIDDDKSSASAAEVCVVWLNRAQNTSVTTLCKSPLWMCQETQVINAVGAVGGGSGIRGGQGSEIFNSDHARRRYRRNGSGLQKSSHEADDGVKNNTINASFSYQEDHRSHRQSHQHGQHKHSGQHQHNGHHSRRRRDGYVNSGNNEVPKGRYGGWVDATVGGAGGGVPSTGGGVSDNSYRTVSATTWWSGGLNINDGGENFVGDDGYAGIAGFGSTGTGAVYSMAALVRRGWETGDKELAPRAPVFAADGQGYVSVAPIRDDEHNNNEDQDSEGGVRLRRPTVKHNQSSRERSSKSRSQSSIGKYYAQVVAVNITKKLLAPLTFGEFDDDNDNNKADKKKSKVVTKSWMVVRILAWDQQTDMIYFLAVPSGRGAPHHRHLYAVKFTPAASSSTINTDVGYRMGHFHQQQFRKTYHHSNRSRPICLSCNIGLIDSVRRRERREFGGKQNRMDEARDDRLRQQQRERWENQKEEEKDIDEEAATAEEAERRQQRNRRQQQREIQNRGMLRHCTYFDAQFSRDGSHYALICLGPSVPYVTLHRIVSNEIDNAEDNSDGSGSGDEADSVPLTTQKTPQEPSYSFELIALMENNTRLQDKYTNRVLLPGTRTFQLRLSGGRKLTTSGGLHFNDPLDAADYYSNGGDRDHRQHFSTKKPPDSDPLTVAQVRLYLPLGVYDPEADPRPEFMSNHIKKSGNSDKIDTTNPEVTTKTSDISSSKHSHRRRRSSSSSSSSTHDNSDDSGNGSKRQRRPRKKQRQHRLKKLYPMLVVVNSDPGSQAITDRFSDRLGYTTGLLCSGSLGRTLPSTSGRSSASSKYSGNEWDRQRSRGRRGRRSTATRYYSSGYSDDYDDDTYDYDQNNDDNTNNNEYVVAVIDTGRGTWARGYESLLALNYGDVNDGYGEDSSEDDVGPSGLLGTADLRDQLEAVEYLLSSSTATSDSFKDSDQGYYSEDRPRSGGSRDRSRWFSPTSQSNRRYYSDDDDYYNGDEEYDDNNDKNDNEDYYYYYYSNDGDNGDYNDYNRGDNFYRDDGGNRNRRNRRSTSDTKANAEALRLPYVDASRVALLGGGPTSPSTPPSIYGGYAATRMALWQTIYGGAPIEKKSDKSGDKGNRKEPVAIRSSFKCAITMAPVCSWRLYVSAFAERYYGYYGGNERNKWMSYDRSDLIPLTPSFNDSSLSPSSSGKGINLLVMHGTADTAIHPQNSMMLVRGVMQQQQQQFVPNGFVSSIERRNNKSTLFGGRAPGGLPTHVGAIRISQLVMPDADLSNSRMATDVENGSPIDHRHQLLHSVFSHVTQYLATECFTNVGDGNRGRGIRTRSQRLRKRRRRWRTSYRDQEKSEEQQQQQWGDEHQRNDKSNSGTSNENSGGGDRSSGGRYRRHNVDSNREISESSTKNDMVVMKIQE
ncbi:uncharacterized protein LOC112595188 isoform X2 [Melanaphis sacchari]|uniref:uncharacterized protein LOC112595188 isoform X2 n=1 Tax=Melanaphis sacchari TaxID=742174 RepID=UPI000DC137D9|nr:uncharacterized protein LOC112595188 isoform X2 [Melanaphis sacchari]